MCKVEGGILSLLMFPTPIGLVVTQHSSKHSVPCLRKSTKSSESTASAPSCTFYLEHNVSNSGWKDELRSEQAHLATYAMPHI